jgi:ubiquinone/menaquinone biosynthesis C-methylase UbiE
MSQDEPVPAIIGPQAYGAWRDTTLGALTERLEQRTMLELTGPLEGAALLDAGCGDGTLVCAAAARGATVTGIDPDPAMLDAARQRAKRSGLAARFVAGRVERLPFADASFDVVASMAVLCFVADPTGAIREMARVLRPGGRLVLGELGRWNGWAAWRRIRAWMGSATWRRAHFRSARHLRALMAQAGLATTTVRGAVYYPPVGGLARLLAPFDSRLGRLTPLGAAFIALRAVKP